MTAELPPEGLLTNVPCGRCGREGTVRLEARLEFADPPAPARPGGRPGGWAAWGGVNAARLAQACRSCGSDFLSTQMRLTASADSVGEMPWVVCELCGAQAAAHRWPWLVCDCGWQVRGHKD